AVHYKKRNTLNERQPDIGATAWGAAGPLGTGFGFLTGSFTKPGETAAALALALADAAALLAAAWARVFPARGGGRQIAHTKPFCGSWAWATKPPLQRSQ